MFFVTLEIPEDAFEGLSEAFALELSEKFADKDRVPFRYIMAAAESYIVMTEVRGIDLSFHPDSILFLNASDSPELGPSWFIENHSELNRYMSPELSFGGTKVFSRDDLEELGRKIELNRTFLRELKNQSLEFGMDVFSSIRMGMIYLPLHYFAAYSPLRFVNVPKIRSLLRYGDKIVLVNSAFTAVVSETWSWINRRIIGLVDLRIQCYESLKDQLAGGAAEAALPPWYSETMTGYWNIAGLPREIMGAFFDADLSPDAEGSRPVPAAVSRNRIPAVLHLVSGYGEEKLGWYFAVNGSSPFAFFVDPGGSAKAIYNRKGKNPEQKTVRINCTIYPNRYAAAEWEIIERCLEPFEMPGQLGISAVIIFDGRTFEIRKRGAYNGALIFSGQTAP
jgi:hypothetical protein